MRALVTGVAGFIGSHIAERLIEDGHSVVGIDDLSAGKESNIPGGVKFIKTNILSIGSYESVLDDIDVVFHNAASKKNICMLDPGYDLQVNGGGPLVLVEACKRHGVKRYVHASTGSVYGEVDGVIHEDTPTNPVSYYGVSKLAGEKYAMLFKDDVHVSVLRYFHVYGSRQEDDPQMGGVVAVFNRQIRENRPITIHGDGSQKRLFTHVDDVVEANMACATLDIPSGSIYNCASGTRWSIIQLAGLLIQKSGKRVLLDYGDPLPGDIYNFDIDNSKIIRELGINFRPFNP